MQKDADALSSAHLENMKCQCSPDNDADGGSAVMGESVGTSQSWAVRCIHVPTSKTSVSAAQT